MNRKQLLIVIGVLSVLCLCFAGVAAAGLYVAGNRITDAVRNVDNPENVRRIAGTIAEYSLPEGYKQSAFDLVLYKYVMLAPETRGLSGGPFIMLMSYPATSSTTDKDIQEEMQRSFARQTGQTAPMRVVETRSISIRGKDAIVTVLEGKLNTGYLMRQWVTVFEGKSGPVMLMIQGYSGKWNDKLIDAFIASIK